MSKAFLPIKSDEDVFIITVKKGLGNCPIISLSPIPTEHITDGNKRLYRIKVKRNFIKSTDPKKLYVEEKLLEKGVKHKDDEPWPKLVERVMAAYYEEHQGETMNPFLSAEEIGDLLQTKEATT